MERSFEALNGRYSDKQDGYYDLERPEMLASIPDNVGSVLEVGCSEGRFGRSIKANRPGVEVWGIEPNEGAANEARKNLDRVINSTFDEVTPEELGREFDCIVFNDVLEHLAAPERALVDSKKYLRSGGFVVASIPNILYFPVITRILIDQDWKYEDWGVLDNTHLRFFTKKSILRLFDECGFDVLNIRGISPCWGKKYNLANFVFLNRLKDWRYQQFAVQAKIRADR